MSGGARDPAGAPTAERRLLARVDEALDGRRGGWRVARTTVGERLVAVELEGDGASAMGVAHCPAGGLGTPAPDRADELSAWASRPPDDDPVAAALGIAALNARSAGAVDWRPGDPMAALDPDVDVVATVGYFGAAFRRFHDVEVRVIEREPVGELSPPAGVSVSVHGPEEAPAALRNVDVLFVTGSSLLYGGTLAYLDAAAAVPTVVLIGATASFVPGPAFAAGVDVLAGVRVTEPEGVHQAVAADACGTDLHGAGLEKVHVAAEDVPAGLSFDAGP
ncbi:MAG: DUF364 domain-containing protein [Halobacteriales archaeon]|nr:DUF364 domain-containing protein [Halobacteriales archaeon]